MGSRQCPEHQRVRPGEDTRNGSRVSRHGRRTCARRDDQQPKHIADGDVHMLLVNDFIGEILKTLGNDIYRMKGVLSIAGSAEKFVYQGVHMIFDGEFQSAWAAGERRCSTLVFIGKNLDKAALEKSFRECLVTPENQARIAAIERVQSMERKGKELLGAA